VYKFKKIKENLFKYFIENQMNNNQNLNTFLKKIKKELPGDSSFKN